MAPAQYMSRGFVHIVDSPPDSRWLRLRGPSVENVNLAGGPTSRGEILGMRFNPHFRSLLAEIWFNEYREGWRLFRIESPYFEVGDVFNNGTEVSHFRSVVIFARHVPNGH